MMVINYQEKNEFIDVCSFGNVALTGFTIVLIHVHQHDTSQSLGEQILFLNTDNIYYQLNHTQFNTTNITYSYGGRTDRLRGN
jgi:hypothetical protein